MKLRSGRQKEKEIEHQSRRNQTNDPRSDQRHRHTLPSPPPPPNTPNQIDDKQVEFDKLYRDLSRPGSFTSKIRRYLRHNVTHSLHKYRRRTFPRRRIVTHFPGQIIQSDLIDMQKYSMINSGYNFILVVIDCFSKKLWTYALKSKRGSETAECLRTIFTKMRYPVQSIIFDQGLEYVNQYVHSLLKEYNIHSYHIKTQHKASTAERVNKTIKESIWKYFTETDKKRWIDILPEIQENYNNTFHETIKMAPNEVTWKNKDKVFKTMFPKIRSRIQCRLKKGDRVRIALFKDIFEKGYTQNWSKDIFTIVGVFQRNGVCWYRLADSEKHIYPKAKYFFELNKV